MSADISLAPVDLAHEGDFQVGGLTVWPSIREVARGEARESLEPRVMRVLVALYRRMDQVVSRDDLLATCWDGRIVGDDAISVCIAKVRKVGEAYGAFAVETIPRVGYRMSKPKARRLAASSLRGGVVIIAIAVLAVVTTAWLGFREWGGGGVPRDPKVVVAPFQALSADSGARTFAASASSEISGALNEAQLQTRVGRAGGRRDFSIDGAVRTEPDGIHIRVTLSDGPSGVVLWSGDFKQAPGRPGVARAIAKRLAAVIDLSLAGRRSAGRTLDPETLALFVKAVDGGGLSEAPLGGMDEVLERAPGFALARVFRAQMLLGQATLAPQTQFSALRDQALAETRAALRDDPDELFAYTLQGAAIEGRRWSEREALHRRGAARQGWNSLAGLAMFLSNVGRLDESARLGRALASQWTWSGARSGVDYAIYLAGSTDEALSTIDRDLAARPGDAQLKAAKLQVAAFGGRYDAAEAVLRDPPVGLGGVGPGTIEAFRAFIAARRSGSEADRRRAIEVIMSASSARRLLRAHAIPMLNDLGAIDEAFQLADIYVHDPIPLRMGQALNSAFLFGPDTVAMRRDRRFVPLMEQLRLVDYWRKSGNWPDFCENEPQSVCGSLKAGN